ncbi:MAG TPA: hypothetical protein PLK75_07400 [Bacteroidales bacterium]|nr:hypothetical protein [Bacteroidales bacterium]
MKILNISIKLVLVAAAVVLVYFIVAGIRKPIDFEKQRADRYQKTISRLIDIRTAQVAYKSIYGCYTPSFDTLINFIKNGKMPVVKAIGSVPDSLTELQALKMGIIKRDTVYLNIKDTLFKHIDYPIEEICRIPVGTKVKFRMDTASVMTGSEVLVKVFEAKANNWDILQGLDRQYVINFNEEKDSVLKVGSLETANNNAGNWE